MPAEFYTKSMLYEVFIRRAHQCERQRRNGADNSFMQNIMRKESGGASANRLPSLEKQMEKVKGYMEKALDKFLKRKLSEEEAAVLSSLKARLASAHSATALMEIVEEGLAVTDRFKPS